MIDHISNVPTLTIRELATCLGISESAIRQRMGASLPQACSDHPLKFRVDSLLRVVDSGERQRIVRYCRLSVSEAKRLIGGDEVMHAYVPPDAPQDEDEDGDALMH